MDKKVILIAGATSMIGRACANILSSKNTIIILLGRNYEKLKLLSEETGNESEFFVTDFCSETSVNKALGEIIKKHPCIDTIIYNVAVYPWKTIENLLLEEWQNSIASNLSGAFLLSKAIIPSLKKQRHGKIVYISSIAGEQMGLPYMSASKAGLNGLMRTCAIEVSTI